MLHEIPKYSPNSLKKFQMIILLVYMVGTGLLSIHLGQDNNWDLKHYHYYNGYALFNLDISQDFFAAHEQSYLNPYMDSIQFLMIKYLPPKLTGFLLGMFQGINFYLLAVMTILLIKNSFSLTHRLIIIVSISFLGLFCANVLGEVGTTFSDLTLSNWVLLSVLIIGFSFKSESSTKKSLLILLAGISIGIGTGLKLTIACYLLASLVACLSIRKNGFKFFFLFLIGALFGFLLTNGYWMFLLWKNFQNPLFPLFNGFFKSPYYDLINLKDNHFFPRNIMQTLFYPFYFSWIKLDAETNFQDFRLAFVYLLVIIYSCKIIFKGKIFSQEYDFSQRQFTQYVIIFFIISYVLWQYEFSIHRYVMPLDIMAPLLIYILLVNIFKNQIIINGGLSLILAALLLSMHPMHWGRVKWSRSYFGVKFSQSIDFKNKNAIVLVSGGPFTYLRPFFPNTWHFASFPSPSPSYFNQLLTKWSSHGEYPLFVLFDHAPNPAEKGGFKNWGINLLEPCNQIQTKFGPFFLCPFTLLK